MANYIITGAGDFSPVTVKLTRCVNPHTELTPGGVCPGVLELTGHGPEGMTIPTGTELTLYRDGVQVGIFTAEKPLFRSGLWHITAYDRLCLLETELGQWLYDLPGWPYPLQTLTDKVLERCGLAAANSLPRMGDLPVEKFAARGVTGRQILQWACEIAGCFCRANPAGQAEFAWFVPTEKAVMPTGEHFTYMDGFTCADYTVAPIEKVQLRRTGTDIGAVYPDAAGQKNTLTLTGNYLLMGQSAEVLEQAAKTLFEHMQGHSYTPGRVVTVPFVEPGDIFTVTDTRGQTRTLYAMTCAEENGVLTVEATGSHRREDSAAVNTARYETITGQVLELQADVEGLRIENRSAAGDLAALRLTVEGMETTVQGQRKENDQLKQTVSTLRQSAEGLALELENISKNGTSAVTTATGYTFDSEGLKIRKSGQEMENLLDNTGMYVRRSGEVILQANAAGVQATDVTVRNYLVIGSHARFEDYPENRTACFYLAASGS